jgi:hypothetical protein
MFKITPLEIDRLPGNSSDFQRMRRFTFSDLSQMPHESRDFSPTTSATMATSKLIEECLLALKERTGSSVIAINKWLLSEKKVSTGIRDFLPVNLASSLAVRFRVDSRHPKNPNPSD